MKVSFTLNHHPETWDVAVGEYLLESLRNHHIMSVRRGCDTTSCGICTVLLDGKAVPSCGILTASIAGKDVITVEGIVDYASRLADYMGHHGADQCGYCNPSLALSVYAMQQETPNPTDDDIRDYLVGNLCRCTGYHGQHEAIKLFLENEQ